MWEHLIRGGIVLWAAAVACVCPERAFAHPLLEQAQRKFEQADFEGALALYAQAEAGTDLTRADLVELYLRRALVHHSVGDEEARSLDLFRLATLEPAMELGREVAPIVRSAFEEAAGRVSAPLAMAVDAERTPTGARVTARVENDLAGLVQEVRVAGRAPGFAWMTATNGPVDLPDPPGGRVEVHAEAIGPGGAVLASHGTATEPRTLSLDAVAIENGGGEGGGDGGIVWWPLLVAGTALVAGAVVLIVLLTGGGSGTNVQAPTCCEVLMP
jgi:hypothetical protein